MSSYVPPRARRVLPGFGLTLGGTLVYLAIIVVLPLAALVLKASDLGWAQYWRIVASPRALAAYRTTLWAAGIATAFDALAGLLLAWVLARYRFPGRRLIDAVVDLPFALPTAVAGLALVGLFSGNGWIGRWLEPAGITVAYAPLGIAVAMTFTSMPFVIRTVQPVLEDIDTEIEDAARTLGARPWQIFARVIWPQIVPAFAAGAALAFARALGEFGAIVFISGNLPMRTEVVSLLVFIRLEEYDYRSASALATVLLAIAGLTLFVTARLQAARLRHVDRR
jgi:sulfate transport system permease protein